MLSMSPFGARLRKDVEVPRGCGCWLRSTVRVFDARSGQTLALIESMRLELCPGNKYVAARVRYYSQRQRTVIANLMNAVVNFGFMKEYNNAAWAAAPLLLPKPYQSSSALKYRLTLHLKRANALTVPLSWPLLPIDSGMSDFRDKKCFCLTDFVSSYWKASLPL